MKTYAGIDLHSSNNYIGVINAKDKRLYSKWAKLGSGHANKLTLNLKWHKNASETVLIDQFSFKTAIL